MRAKDGEQAPTRLPHTRWSLSVPAPVKWEENVFLTPYRGRSIKDDHIWDSPVEAETCEGMRTWPEGGGKSV